MNRLGLKLGCLVVAIVIWMQVASTATVEQTASLPLRITGLEEGTTVVGSVLPTEVAVRLRGSKLRLLAQRYLHRPVGEVRVDVSERAAGRPFTYVIAPANVVTELDVTDIVGPDRLTIRIDGHLTRRLPVALSTIGALPPGYGYVTPPAPAPDSVTVSGPARFFPERPVVRTAPLDLAQLAGSRTVTLHVLPPDNHLQLSAHEVTVSYGVGPLAERTMADVPVAVVADAAGPEVGVSPAHADVLVRGVADSLRTLAASRVRLTVQAAGLAPGVHLLPGDVTAPGWVTVIGIEPAQFQVIVGTRAEAAGGRDGRGG